MKLQPLNAWQRARMQRFASEQRHRRLFPWLLLGAWLMLVAAAVAALKVWL